MTNTDLATRDSRPPMVVLREFLQSRESELKAALTDISPEQFIRAVMTSVAINQEILACSRQSIWLACMRACRDGLLPDGVDGAIVPYKATATWIPMYQGKLRQFRRSGQFKWVTANVVRSGEEFSHYIDETGEHFKHVPGDNFAAAITKIYALATTKDGGVFVTVMSIAEANKHRNMSRATRDDAPWKQWPEEMYKKTALIRLSKYLPNARDLLSEEEHIEVDTTPTPTLVTAPAEDTAASAPGIQASSGAKSGERDIGTETDAPAAADEPPMTERDDDTAVASAYERGKSDKSKGAARRAIPGEYRDPARTREALAWQAGFDGQEMPTFSHAG